MGEGENSELNPTSVVAKEYTEETGISGKSIVLHYATDIAVTTFPKGTTVTLFDADEKIIGTNTLTKNVNIDRASQPTYGTSTTFLYEGSTEREGSWGTTKAITGFNSATKLGKVVIEFELAGTKYVGVQDVTPFE